MTQERRSPVAVRTGQAAVELYASGLGTACCALPCVENDAEVRAVDVTRIRMAVRTGNAVVASARYAGWCSRPVLDQRLQKGEAIDMDASWLARC